MTRPSPSQAEILPLSAFVLPPLAVEPLRTIMRNINAVWLYHQPPHIQAMPANEYHAGVTSAQYAIPISPSADGLPYFAELALTPLVTVTRTYEYSATGAIGALSVWTSLGSYTGSTGASGIVQDSLSAIPANSRGLRVTLSSASAFFPQSIVVYPRPTSIPAGVQPSGFIAYDDGILEGAAGAPLHQEFLDRCRRSPLAVWHDRLQCGLSLVCELNDRTNYPAQAFSTGVWRLASARIRLPGYGGETAFKVRAIAEHSSGAPVSGVITVRLSGVDAASVTLGATKQTESGTIKVTPAGTGIEAYVDAEIEIRSGGGGTTYLHGLCIWPEA
jgi:hypothetical protein